MYLTQVNHQQQMIRTTGYYELHNKHKMYFLRRITITCQNIDKNGLESCCRNYWALTIALPIQTLDISIATKSSHYKPHIPNILISAFQSLRQLEL